MRHHQRSARKTGHRILLDAVEQATKDLSHDTQKYARLRWGSVSHRGFDTAEAAWRLGIPIRDALAIESHIIEKLPWFSGASRTISEFGDKDKPLIVLPLSAEIVLVSQVVSRQLVAEILKAPDLLHGIHHRKFEELIAFFFAALGYDVELTKRTRDGGRDVIALRRGEIDVRYLVECKRPAAGTPIGIRPVRELYGVKVDEGATKALLATTSYFSSDAREFAERHRWELELKDHDAVLEWLRLIP